MRVVIVTGMSGAGKSQALNIFEDLGYFCIDNMIPALIPYFFKFVNEMKATVDNVALGIDIRGREFFKDLYEFIYSTQTDNIKYEILFVDANDEVLIKRFKENRRRHPLEPEGRIIKGIEKERELLSNLKNRAEYIIDTSTYTRGQLKEKIMNIFNKNSEDSTFNVNILSFGFKYGIPTDVDLMFDVRFAPNPYYIDDLKLKNGKDKEVRDYVLKWEQTREFINKLEDMLTFLIPYYISEGKSQLIIGIGCTGGQHRSVAISEEITNRLRNKNYKVKVEHREQEKINK